MIDFILDGAETNLEIIVIWLDEFVLILLQPDDKILSFSKFKEPADDSNGS